MQSINFDEIEDCHSGAIARLTKSFHGSKRIVALTGAGISVSAGIPVI